MFVVEVGGFAGICFEVVELCGGIGVGVGDVVFFEKPMFGVAVAA